MRQFTFKVAVFAVLWNLTTSASILFGFDGAFSDPGFENYTLSGGEFVKPTSGPWMFVNDASVVEPYSPNSSTALLNTWSATFAAMEGEQYACTYAGLDSIRQTISFGTAGEYRISAYAAAPDGSVTIPGHGTLLLEDGEFTFALGSSAIGSLHTVPAGSSWTSYSADFTIEKPGNYTLGIWNTKTDSYFINYDSFSIHPVPEPSTMALLAMGGAGVLFAACRRHHRSSSNAKP
jgi:hypothetical protein